MTSLRKSILCGLILVAVGTAAIWLFTRPTPKIKPSKIAKPNNSQIASVAPKIVTNKVAKIVPAKPKQNKPWPDRSPHPDGKWRHGEGPRSIAVTNGCVVSYPHCPGVQLILPHPAFAAPFKNISDNEIARLLSIKPGDDFIDAPLPHDFDKRFAESLLTKIEDSEDDTPEKKALKQQVREARKMLVEAVRRGESPRDILTEEAKTMRRLMQIKDNYQSIINQQIKEGASDQEISDIATAANQLLTKEGINSKVRLPYKVQMRLKQEKNSKEKQD